MTHGSTCFRAGKSCSARIRKQVQYIYLTSGTAYLIRHKVPVYSLLGEKSGMLESGRADIECERTVTYLPAVGKLFPELPLAAALVRAVIMTVCTFPERVFFIGFPYYLGVGSHKGNFSPFFELFSVRCI